MSYIDLLSAQQQWQQNQIVENQAHADRYSDTVGLFVALGGGWDT
jgi:outer membrane protein TolC